MAFLNQLSEKLDAQIIYTGLAGKYETRFRVNGIEYAFIATSIAGDSGDNSQWMLEFENTMNHRINFGDGDPKVAKAFGEAVGQWIKERAPVNFYTYGSHCESIQKIIAAIKKQSKGYEIVDDTANKKNKENGEVIEGNLVGKITWTKMLVQDTVPVVDTEDREAIVSDKFKSEYELPNDIKTKKEFMSGTSKKDKLDKGDKAYDLKTESAKDVDFYVKKFKDKMKGSSNKTAIGWINGIKKISKEDKNAIKKKLGLVKESESFAEFRARKLNEEEDFEPVEPEDEDCFYSPSGSLGSKTSVRCGGKFIGEFDSDEEALEAIRNWQDKHQWWPNIWFVSDHGNAILVDKEGNEIKESIQDRIKTESFAEFKARKLNEDFLDEGKGKDALKGAARAAIKKISEKMKDILMNVKKIASNKEQLLKWLEINGADFTHAMDLARHMMDKKQLTFEEEILSGEILKENILDLIAKKSPKTLMATALILTIMGCSDQHIFNKNDSGEEALKKAKKSVEQIVDIVKEQGGKAGEHVQKGAREVGKEVKKGAKEVGTEVKKGVKEVGKNVEKKAEEVGSAIKKGAEEFGDSSRSKADQFNQGFQSFIQKKKAEQKPEHVKPKLPKMKV